MSSPSLSLSYIILICKERTSRGEVLHLIDIEDCQEYDPEEIAKTMINLNKLYDTLNLKEDEVKLALDHFKRRLIPQSPFELE